MNDETNQELIKQRVDYFYKNNKFVHIQFKKGYWKNGSITEISSDFFMLDELLEGLQPVFFLEIEEISPYTIKDEVKK